jgi:tRNA 2-thiouridine synthesizing protein C
MLSSNLIVSLPLALDMTATVPKKILFILRSSPYGSAMAQEGVDSVLAASVFEQDISVLFMDEGLWQLHHHQQSLGIQRLEVHPPMERKNIAAQLDAFPLYDIHKVYADKNSLKHFSMTKKELILKPKLLSDKAIRELIAEHDVVLSY